VAVVRKKAHRDETYWGRPVPSFGDPEARLLIVGLAPAAHGANRTGRMFTGDSSGDWLYEALHRYGFASQPRSVSRGDGLRLSEAWVTAVNHCAPPDNRPTPAEQALCRPFLVQELSCLRDLRVILTLGRIAFEGTLKALAERGEPVPHPRPAFGHEVEFTLAGPGGVHVLGSYHPSRQNTNTGKLTRPMFHARFRRAREILDISPASAGATDGTRPKACGR
jgi:uracil-DNA glycosylase family 4